MATRGPGGAETFFVRLVGALRAHVDQHALVRRDSWLARRMEELGVSYDSLIYGGSLDVATDFSARRRARAYRPDLVMTWMARASSRAPLVGAPVVARLGGYYNLKYFRRADWLVGNTRDIVGYLVRQGWPADRAVYIPNFADGRPSPHPAADRRVKRAELGCPDDAPLAIAAGRLHRCKGFDLLLDAIARLDRPLWLAIAGSGEERAALEERARALGIADRVAFLGWVDDLAPWIAAADLWLAPSRDEPLGNIVLDAWLHEKPILASNVVGPAALIDHGRTGYLFELDAEAIAATIEDAISRPEATRAMAARGRAENEARFSKDAVVRAYLELFDRAIVRAPVA